MDRICFILLFHFLHLQDFPVSGNCTGERSQNGCALLHSNYTSQITNDFSDCVGLCFEDLGCLSITFKWDTNRCDINNESRETCPRCYTHDATATYMGMGRNPVSTAQEVNQLAFPQESCSSWKKFYPSAKSGVYVIDPDGPGGESQFTVSCDMTGVGVTIISHDSENSTFVNVCAQKGCYSRDVHYKGASLSQLASLTRVSSQCEQFIKYECHHSKMFREDGYAWWVSRDSIRMTYWGGASPGSGKCACGVTNSCANPYYVCNCDSNDYVWREDSGLLTDKSYLPVMQLRFGDNFGVNKGKHTLGKFKCSGIV